jgi:hypothetical protein
LPACAAQTAAIKYAPSLQQVIENSPSGTLKDSGPSGAVHTHETYVGHQRALPAVAVTTRAEIACSGSCRFLTRRSCTCSCLAASTTSGADCATSSAPRPQVGASTGLRLGPQKSAIARWLHSEAATATAPCLVRRRLKARAGHLRCGGLCREQRPSSNSCRDSATQLSGLQARCIHPSAELRRIGRNVTDLDCSSFASGP